MSNEIYKAIESMLLALLEKDAAFFTADDSIAVKNLVECISPLNI